MQLLFDSVVNRVARVLESLIQQIHRRAFSRQLVRL